MHTTSAGVENWLQKYKLRDCEAPPATMYSMAGSRMWPME